MLGAVGLVTAGALAWLAENTDVIPRMVIDVSDGRVVAMTQLRPGREPGVSVATLRAEELDPGAPVLSWHAEITLDCVRGQVRMGKVTGYRARNLLGPAEEAQAAAPAASTPAADDYRRSALRAACDPTFERPFAREQTARSAQSAP